MQAIKFYEILNFSKKGIFVLSPTKFKFREEYFFIIVDRIWVVWFLSVAEIGEQVRIL